VEIQLCLQTYFHLHEFLPYLIAPWVRMNYAVLAASARKVNILEFAGRVLGEF